MTKYVARPIRFRNGERFFVLSAPNGLPVHEVTLFLGTFRTRGLAANTIRYACVALALLYRMLGEIDLLARLRSGKFLSSAELGRLTSSAQYRIDELIRPSASRSQRVVDIRQITMRRKATAAQVNAVVKDTHSSRLRYIANFLEYLVDYVHSGLPMEQQREFKNQCAEEIAKFRAAIPKTSRNAKLGKRQGLSREIEDRLLSVIDPLSPNNPWHRPFVRERNWIIFVLMLGLGIRVGELLGIDLADLDLATCKVRIVRRADAIEDPRLEQPNPKTRDRELELRPRIMKRLVAYISDRRHLRFAAFHPKLIVTDDGKAISMSAAQKLFADLRRVCPWLPDHFTSHALRFTWNDRFSEKADELSINDAHEASARNEQQGWSENSKSAAVYTRRSSAAIGRSLSLKLQEKLDAEI
jgi:integrase